VTPSEKVRADYALIADLVPEGARVLDLGCGDSALLDLIRREKDAFVRGVEIHGADVALAIARGLSVFQGDLDEGLADFPDASFDVVILSQTLQVVRYPRLVLEEMLRVGTRAIVSFPNFGYWRTRTRLFFTGHMPVNRSIPYQWYDTPNIHHTTIKDFARLVDAVGGRVVRSIAFEGAPGESGRIVNLLPNLTADTAVFVLERAVPRA
jgi:methionine biosynthesis protein MetW